jgi:hypothetical protein
MSDEHKSTFFKVRCVITKLFYNPNKAGNRIDPTFDSKGKKYRRLAHAKNAVEFCESPINNHWAPPVEKTPIKTEIVEYAEITKEIRVIKR